MTAPDMVSIIAGVLAAHWTFSTDTDGYPRFVDRCDGCHEIVFNHGREDNQNQSYAAHQARAVLAAISEAGQVEWAIFRKIADENALPFDWSAGKTYGQSMSRIERMYPRDRDQLQPRSRITGPWTAVE